MRNGKEKVSEMCSLLCSHHPLNKAYGFKARVIVLPFCKRVEYKIWIVFLVLRFKNKDRD
jgi:hypothetical protein